MKNNIDDFLVEENNFDILRFPAFKFLILLFIFISLFSLFKFNFLIVAISVVIVFLATIFKLNKTALYILISLSCAILLQFRVNLSSSPQIDYVVQEVPAIFIGKVSKILSEKDSSIQIIARGNIKSSKLPKIHKSNVMLWLRKKKGEKIFFEVGNEIISEVNIRPPQKNVLPDDFDGEFYAKFNDIQWFARSSLGKISIRNKSKNIIHFFKNINENISQQVDLLFHSSHIPIIKALIIGNKNELPDETKKMFSNTGTAHVLAVSGLHVGVISSIILLFLRGFNNRKIKLVIFTVLILLYIAITGFSISVVRAGVMAISLYFVNALERRSNMLNILSIAILIMIFIDPAMMYSPSFQMSVASVLGITLLFPILNNNLQKIFLYPKSIVSKKVLSSLAITMSVSIIVSPLVANYFKVFSVVSPLANLIIVPLFSLIMLFAIISLLLSAIYFPLGAFYASSVDWLLSVTLKLNIWANSLQEKITFIGNREIIIAILISSVIIYLFISNSRQKYIFRIVVSIVLFSLVFAIIKSNENSSGIKIYSLNKVAIAEIPIRENEIYYYIADRMKYRNPHSLKNVKKYLLSKKQDLTIGVTGIIGLSTAKELQTASKELQKNKRIKIQLLNRNQQHRIEKLINLNTELGKYIKLDTDYRK